MNADDPSGKDDIFIESNELHLAKNQPVKIFIKINRCFAQFLCSAIQSKNGCCPRYYYLLLV